MRKMPRLRAQTLHGLMMLVLTHTLHRHLKTLWNECQWIKKSMRIARMNQEESEVWLFMLRSKLLQLLVMTAAGRFGTSKTKRIL